MITTEKFNVFGGENSYVKFVTEARLSKGLRGSGFLCIMLYVINPKKITRKTSIGMDLQRPFPPVRPKYQALLACDGKVA